MELIRLGQITGVSGLKGELRVYPYTDYKEKFEELPHVLLDGVIHEILKVRYNKNMVILKLSGIDSREAAEAQRDKILQISRADAGPLPEDTYYVADLIGIVVVNEDGENIGALKDVIKNSAQDLYEIERSGGKTFLLPAVQEFVKEVNLDERKMTVHLIEGMVDDEN